MSLAFIAASLLPVSGLVPFLFQQYSTVADHYFYFPMIGVSLFAGSLTFLESTSPRKGTVLAAFWIIILSLLGYRSVLQLNLWEDQAHLFEHTLQFTPNSIPMQNNLGVVYFKRQEWDKALEQFQTSLNLVPTNPKVYVNLALALERLGRHAESDSIFQKILATFERERETASQSEIASIQHETALIHLLYARALTDRGKTAEAIQEVQKSLQLNPTEVGKNYLQKLLN